MTPAMTTLERFKLGWAQTLLRSLSALQVEQVISEHIQDKVMSLQSESNRNLALVKEREEQLQLLQKQKEEVENALKAVQQSKQQAEQGARTQINELQVSVQKLRNQVSTAQSHKEVEKATHPVYGTLLHDFGFKKVYASNPEALCDKSQLPVWMKQRLYNPKRAEAIAQAKRKDPRFGFPGTITIYENSEEVRGVLDGQHRIGGLKQLIEAGAWNTNELVLTEVYETKEDKDINDLFVEINLSQPLKQIDLPGEAEDNVRDTINQVCLQLQDEYSAMFSQSPRCRRPHVHVDDLRQTIFDCGKLVKTIRSTDTVEQSVKKLLAMIKKQNEAFDKMTDTELLEGERNPPSQKVVEKCRQNKFYLGLKQNWVDAV